MKGRAPPLHQRYEQIRMLGRGGAGAVYLVRDHESGEKLALKRLLRADTQSMLRLKREFRSLADIHHPNLVKLYELGHDQTSAYFTMEYLEGEELKHFLDYAAPPSAASNDNIDDDAAHVARVLGAFAQLASGVRALHRAGVLHRDLKPSNVMVESGRVVVLDFGLALEVGTSAATVTQDQLISGTPAYMAPEQIQGEHLGEPNDWYAFGVMLYEALSGSLPIEGTLLELLQRKVTQDATPIDTLAADLPKEVSELCMSLLQRAPDKRPNGEQVMNVLRQYSMNAATPATLSVMLSDPASLRTSNDVELSLFGREPEIAALWSAYRIAQAGGFAAVHVSGESGSGKSLLVQNFTEALEGRGFAADEAQPLVLRSRCYERETLPFKALDGAIDALVNHLLRENDITVSHSLPRDVLPLTQLFPSFNRLPVMQRLLDSARPPVGTSQARAQAEAALHDLLRRLGSQRPIVLWVDDLQWGDLDSTAIMASWLKPPLLPHVMLVFSYRSEEIGTSPCLALLRQRAAIDPAIETTISLRALGEDHVRALCRQRFERAQIPADTQIGVTERIVREAQGSPFLASQLAALVVAQPTWGEEQLASLSLQQLVLSRSSTLSGAARRVLHVLSVAGRPIALSLALRTANIARDTRAVIHELQGLHFIRTRDASHERLLEVYHDRLREVVASLMSADERMDVDRRLLSELRNAASTDNDWLHVLALAVGERAAALGYGLAAAERASDMLAFERAAELYERCLLLSQGPAADGGKLRERLALAYGRAGHGTKAAAVYLQAAQHVEADQALVFERAAASHLLCSGRFEEGEALLQRVLARLHLEAPSTEAGLYAAIGWERARGALRGLAYTPRTRAEIPFETYQRGLVCGMLSMETAAYDPLRAALFQARSLRMALDGGEPEGVARALCAAATMACVSGSERGKRRGDELLAKAEAISSTVASTVLRTNIVSARSICAFLTGRIAESIELAYEAENLHRTSTVDSEYHHRFTIVSARIGALLQTGEYRRADAELQLYVKEAEATENINALLHITMAQARADVIAARTEQAVKRLDRQREQLPKQGFGLLHVFHMIAVFRIGCATGDYDWALGTTHEHWQMFQRSVVRRNENFSMFAYATHARLLLSRCVRDGTQRDAPRLLAPHIKVLASSKHRDAKVVLARIRGRLASIQGDKAAAQRWLETSMTAFEQRGARDEAARDRYALGVLTGGEKGQAMARDAAELLTSLGVVDVRREIRGYYPELVGMEP